MRRIAFPASLGLLVGIGLFVLLDTSEQTEEAGTNEGRQPHSDAGGDSSVSVDLSNVPESRNPSESGPAKASSSDFGAIGLPDLSHFDLAPGVETTLREWREAGCIDEESVRLDALDPSAKHHAEEWLKEEGYPGGLDFRVVAVDPTFFDDYGSYSEETLGYLADDADDPKAAQALALRLHRNEALADAKERYEQAIILGYTRPLMAMPLLRFRLLTESSDNEPSDDEAQWEYEVERLTSDLIRERRGAPFSLTERLMLYIRSQESGLSSGHSWQETWQEARRRAQNRYEEYRRRRTEEGLAPFDNSRPPVATQLDRYAHLYVIGRQSNLDLCQN